MHNHWRRRTWVNVSISLTRTDPRDRAKLPTQKRSYLERIDPSSQHRRSKKDSKTQTIRRTKTNSNQRSNRDKKSI